MNRVVACFTAALLTGCIFSKKDDEPDTDMPSSDMNGQDVTSDMGGVEPRDEGSTADLSPPRDVGQPDIGPDMSDAAIPDVGPDMDSPQELSAVCEMGVTAGITGAHRYRLRTNTSDSRVSVGYVDPGEGVDVLAVQWSQWETFELWVNMQFAGSTALEQEVVMDDPTGIASVPWFGVPGGIVTRRNTQNCIYAEWNDGSTGSLDCTGAWGPEIANLATSPRYFWFGDDGTISSMPTDDFDPLGQRITVPWCAQDPDSPTECLPLAYGTVDVRANRGPNVLLSDSLGRAYIWDVVQNIDASQNTEDCVTPPTPPVPLFIQNAPVMFADADLVRVGGDDFLVHQTATFVSVHPLGSDLQPLAANDQLPNGGDRPHFDATSDGTRIAAVTAVGSDARVFAFGATPGTRDVVVDDDDTFNATAAGVAIRGDQVAVTVGGEGFFVVKANAFVMWD